MNKAAPATAAVAALALPVTNAVSAAHALPKKKVVTVKKTVTGSTETAGRWGDLQVTIVVKKTTTTVGKKSTVVRKIAGARVPVYPDHTDRSVFINQQALPMLVQEALQVQFDVRSLQLVSGATDSSYAFGYSLQNALLRAKKV